MSKKSFNWKKVSALVIAGATIGYVAKKVIADYQAKRKVEEGLEAEEERYQETMKKMMSQAEKDSAKEKEESKKNLFEYIAKRKNAEPASGQTTMPETSATINHSSAISVSSSSDNIPISEETDNSVTSMSAAHGFTTPTTLKQHCPPVIDNIERSEAEGLVDEEN